MKIHSLSGCACWNWGESHNPPMREVYRRNILEYGHTEGCPHHHVMAFVVRMREKRVVKDPSLVCCVNCLGQGYLAAARGHRLLCRCDNGQMRRYQRSPNPPERHDQHRFWRKRRHSMYRLAADSQIKRYRRRGDHAAANDLALVYFPERVRWDARTMEPMP